MVKWPIISKVPFISKFRNNTGFIQISVANIAAAALNGTLWLVLASFLSPIEYGKINYYIAIASVSSVVGTFGLNTLNITNIARKVQTETPGTYTFVLVLSVIVSLIIGTVTQSPLTGLLCFSLAAFSMSISEPIGKTEYASYMKIVISSRVSLIFFALVLYFLFGLNGIMIGYCISLLVFSKAFFYHLVKSKLNIAGFSRKNMKFSFHSFFMNIAQSSNLFIDKIIIAPLYGFHLLGLYQISTQFLMILAIVPTSLFLYLLPREAQGHSNMKMSIGVLSLSVIFSITLFFSSDMILQELFPNFVSASPVVKIVAFGAIPMTAIASSNSRLLGAEGSGYVFLGAIIFLATIFCLLLLFRGFNDERLLGISLVSALSAQAIFLWFGERRVMVFVRKD